MESMRIGNRRMRAPRMQITYIQLLQMADEYFGLAETGT